jgi:hypothetical protein
MKETKSSNKSDRDRIAKGLVNLHLHSVLIKKMREVKKNDHTEYLLVN